MASAEARLGLSAVGKDGTRWGYSACYANALGRIASLPHDRGQPKGRHYQFYAVGAGRFCLF